MAVNWQKYFQAFIWIKSKDSAKMTKKNPK